MKPLDFLVIGAQKCATTALFENLRAHPDIVMPLEKELPFFTGEDCSEQAWEEFCSKHFPPANSNKLWGKASPQYMCDPNAPARIKALMPGVKLIAILRDPIERCWSHHKMGQRRATEHKAFAEAIDTLLSAGDLQTANESPIPQHTQGYQSESDFYVAWSEYGRILANYLDHFEAGQLLVLYKEDLEANPKQTIDTLLEFIGLPAGFRPTTLGQMIHRGGVGNRIPQGVREWLRQRKLIYRLWQLLPESRRGRLRFQYEQWNVRKVAGEINVPQPTRQALNKHFASDIQSLLSLPVPSPPWAEHYKHNS